MVGNSKLALARCRLCSAFSHCKGLEVELNVNTTGKRKMCLSFPYAPMQRARITLISTLLSALRYLSMNPTYRNCPRYKLTKFCQHEAPCLGQPSSSTPATKTERSLQMVFASKRIQGYCSHATLPLINYFISNELGPKSPPGVDYLSANYPKNHASQGGRYVATSKLYGSNARDTRNIL